MAQIHPTASVAASVRLAEDVVVGPNCSIQGDVVVGPGSRLIGHVYIHGPARIGARNTLYPFTCVGFAPQHRGIDPAADGPGVDIGDDNVLRESVTIHRGSAQGATTLGDRNYLMVASHVGHDSIVGHDCTFANSTLLAGHVTVGDGVTMGGNAGLHQHCRVGRLCMIGGIIAPRQDVPPFCVVYPPGQVGALNLVGLRRAGLRDHIGSLKIAFEILFQSGHSNPQAGELIERELGHDPLCRELVTFIRGTKRGIVAYAGRRPLRPAQSPEA